ncbi:hypothetical protein SNE40_018849 [Patella caerulea]|uniref:Trafficking protein particle complex subunit 10 n=1 Tax=Patella caerulea TaxID=87958 RepID=A0AAN8J5N0_PATCE
METKPIVTCHGDQSLFSGLHAATLHGLPKEACEWRRSYGRAPRTIHLEASFVPYDADILPDETTKTLVSRPYFHIYWTDCDLESYKQTVREDIAEWHSALKEANIPDWLIVVVINDESKIKSKLLPRSSVIDKVRNDFCSKQADRCIVLSEPMKTDQKTAESWYSFFQRLRQLLLQAFNHHLDKYEDKMRSLREKRNEPGWNYFDYFIFQEELAFMFEMLGLFEDALIQYDELDALFTQFVENHASGDVAEWLTSTIQSCKSWAGLSLYKPIDWLKRDMIKLNKVSLLEFRNYLFSRHSALLFLMNKSWIVAQRAMDFLYNTAQEIHSLEIDIPQGALSCWMFMSCLEVLRACETLPQTTQLDRYSLYTATLRDYARTKLKDLGYLCGLMPGSKPTSEQLSHVVDLSAGMGLDTGEETEAGQVHPRDRLREALSSESSFKKHYLEMCELTMGTYKHISRFRSARILGRDMADFYMKIGEPQKAEGFLLDAIKMYQQENWGNLADGTMLDLAQCLLSMNEVDKYFKTACHIACSCCLKLNDRKEYFKEVLRLASENEGNMYQMRASTVFTLEEANINNSSVILHDDFIVDLTVKSNFPEQVVCNQIEISIIKAGDLGTSPFKRRTHVRNPSLTFKNHEHIPNFRPITKQLPTHIDAHSTYERRNGKVVSCAIGCANAHDLLKRCDSGPVESEIVLKGDYSLCMSVANVTLNPGCNDIQLRVKTEDKGVYRLSQICYKIKQSEFLKSLANCDLHFEVVCNEPYVELKPSKQDNFLAGIQQDAILALHTGSYNIPDGSVITIEFNGNVTILTESGDNSIRIGGIASRQTVEYKLSLYQETKQQVKQTTDVKMSCKVDCWDKIMTCNLSFHHPFQVTHKLHTAKEKKYLQIVVCGNVESEFYLVRPELSCLNCLDLELIPYNKLTQQWRVSFDQSATFLWMIKPNISDLPNLDMCFNFKYTSTLDVSGEQRLFSYICQLEHFQTQYQLSYTVTSDDKTCTTSTPATLTIHVQKAITCSRTDHRLVYQVSVDGTTWALAGKSTGVFNVSEREYETKIDVLPLQSGLLHMPFVNIHQYIDSTDNQTEVWVRKPSDSDTSDVNKPVKDVTRFAPFNTGEVYNNSQCQQVHIYPSLGSLDSELIVIPL